MNKIKIKPIIQFVLWILALIIASPVWVIIGLIVCGEWVWEFMNDE